MSAAATIPIVDDDPTRRGVHGFITKPYDQDAPLDEVRKALVERFKLSQRVAQKDPWAERAAGRELREFTPLAVLSPIRPRDVARVPVEVAE